MWIGYIHRLDQISAFLWIVVLENEPFEFTAGDGDSCVSFLISEMAVVGFIQ